MMYNLAAERSYPTPLANSTLLPLMVMSLISQKNAPSRLQTPTSIYSSYDFIVVGAGSAGSTVAARLSEIPCVNVLLLEAGKPAPILNDVPGFGRSYWFTDLDWTYKTVPQNHTGRLMDNRQIPWPLGKGIGGSSLLNAMLYVRGNKKNYNDWAAQGAKGWSYDDVLPYFKKLEDFKEPQFASNGYHGKNGPITVETPNWHPKVKKPIFDAAKEIGYEIVDSNGPKQTGFYNFQGTVRNGQRCSVAKGYLVPAENRTNLHILSNAFVKKILFNGNKAVGVSFKVKDQTYEVKANREVIVSAGSTKTPQLLMLSGIGPKEDLQKFGIPVLADLPVGLNFQDHCSTFMDVELGPNIEALSKQVQDPENVKLYINNRSGPLAGPEYVTALAFLKDNLTRPQVDDPNYELYFIVSATHVPLTQFGLPKSVSNDIYGPYENKPFYVCLSSILQPKSRGYVKLQSANPEDPPLINPNYFNHPQDLKDIIAGMKACNKIATSKPLRDIGAKPFRRNHFGCEQYANNDDDYYACQAGSIVMTMSHAVGTTKMGSPNDKTTVVDPDLRVKGIQGLRVVDASVMPIVPSGNTNIPTIMVAEKASDIIKETIQCNQKTYQRMRA